MPQRGQIAICQALTAGQPVREIGGMCIEQLRALLEATPFVPFSLVLPNGEKLRVPHSDFAWIHPSGRSVVVALKGDIIRIVNWQMVTSIETKAAAA